jgi:hypothetical protein
MLLGKNEKDCAILIEILKTTRSHWLLAILLFTTLVMLVDLPHDHGAADIFAN